MRLSTRLLALLGLLAVPVLLALASEQLAARPDAPLIRKPVVTLDGVSDPPSDAAPPPEGDTPAEPVVPTQITRTVAPPPPPAEPGDDAVVGGSPGPAQNSQNSSRSSGASTPGTATTTTEDAE